MRKHVALFEVKAVDGDDPNGEFEAILSVPVVDRDGEVVAPGAFNPLPAEIPIHKFHNFSQPVATAMPYYDGDVLKARGVFDPDPESQALRSKVGRSIKYMSVGFMAPNREVVDGVPHITKAELLEASFVSVPSNREAAILAVKAACADHDGTFEPAAKAAEKSAGTDPEEAAAPAAADPPADVTAAMARLAALRAQADLLLLD